MTKWNVVKLGEVCSISSSKRIYAREYQSEGIPFYRGKEIIQKHNGNEVSTELFITRQRYEEIKNKFDVPQKGDILLSCVGTLGVSWLVDEEEFYFKDGNLTWLRCNKKTTPQFLYLWLNSPEAQNQIDAMCIGSTQKALTIETLKKFDITLPRLEIQEKICEIINPISKKITVNRATNRNLEEQTLALFKSWFIDLDPWSGEVPSSWHEGALGEYVTIKRGGSPRPIKDFISEYGLRWLKISDVSKLNSPYVIDIKERIKESGLKKTVLLNKGSFVLSNSATPGIPKILDVDSCIHDGWLYFLDSQLSNQFLYLFFKHIRPNLVAMGNGSVFTNLKTDILKAYPIVKPDNKTLNDFDEVVLPMFKEMQRVARENQKLSSIRDTLLPKLMSGELNVADLDI
ncbi:MAG: restriction endonuclease subunit S [Vallitalea sp.]|jgi:type I restriction enzyme S subunit|nr:restriction endonuclease subunit S [Vallitalea sp.]